MPVAPGGHGVVSVAEKGCGVSDGRPALKYLHGDDVAAVMHA